MEVFRLQRNKYGLALSGLGASVSGARWNSPGYEIIYTSTSRSLAMAEVAVHLTLGTMPSDFFMLHIFIPDHISMLILQERDLPADWNTHPPPLACRQTGDTFIAERKYCLLKIPSAVTHGDYNILINPGHPEFSGIRVLSAQPFTFDQRLFKPD
jgi:RES domain-containing protein